MSRLIARPGSGPVDRCLRIVHRKVESLGDFVEERRPVERAGEERRLVRADSVVDVGRSNDLPAVRPMKKTETRIWTVIVRIDGAYGVSRNPPFTG